MPRSRTNHRADRPPASTDVARLAGVSQKTVSRVMNDEPYVTDEVKRRVLQAARDLGYRRNSAARALTSGRTRTIAFVSVGSTLHGPAAMLMAAEREARRRGYSLSVHTHAEGDPTGLEGAIEATLGQGVDGIVLSEPIQDRAIHLKVDVPVLTIGRFPGVSAPHMIQVGGTSKRAGRIATSHLLDLGHENVRHIAGPQKWYVARERLAGWRQALQRAGAEEHEPLFGDWSSASGYETGRELAQDASVTAVFAANDDMAIGLIRAMVEAGRTVPADVSVVGFDDIPLAPFLNPPLTTIVNPFGAIAANGLSALVEAIENPESPTPRVRASRVELKVRESTGPRPTRRRAR